MQEHAGAEVLIANASGQVIYPSGGHVPEQFKLPEQGEHFRVSVGQDGQRYGMSWAKLDDPLPGSPLGWTIVLRQPLKAMLAGVDELKTTALFYAGLATLLLVLLIHWVARWISRPLEALTEFSRRIEAGDIKARPAVRSPVREFAALADGLTRMTQRLLAEEQALLALNQELEGKVQARTRELEAHRDQLEGVVFERTKELAGARDAAEASSRAKSQILSSMSHELRTPLNHVLGLGVLLKREALSEKGQDKLAKLLQAGERLLKLVNNLLEMARIEADEIQVEKSVFSANLLVEELAETLASDFAGSAVAFDVALADDLAESIEADSRLLTLLIRELVDNARKFTAAGQVSLSVSARNHRADLFDLRVEVRDTGIGISPEVRELMFKLFSQGDASATRRYGGTGLGLALCKRVVSLMAGEIGCDELADAGALFWFEVPVRRVATVDAAVAPLTVAEIESRLESLQQLLKEASPQSPAVWAAVRSQAHLRLGDSWAIVDRAIHDEDFDVAAQLLAERPALGPE